MISDNRLGQELESSLTICCAASDVWEKITNVDLTVHQVPLFFRILGIPRPLRAELTGQGIGAKRTAWFDNNKRFTQVVTEWQVLSAFRFNFAADPGFIVGYLFDLSAGPFQILEGWYRLTPSSAGKTELLLGTRYYCNLPRWSFLPTIIRYFLTAYQVFLLRLIKVNCEQTR